MFRNTEIADEIREISPVLAGIGNAEVYTAPAGYFGELPGSLVNRIRLMDEMANSEIDNQPVISSKENTFHVPAGYFDGFAGNLMARIKTQSTISEVEEELNTIAPILNTISRDSLYHVPSGYFEGLAEIITESAKAGEIYDMPQWFTALKSSNIYEVPQGYFEKFPAAVLGKVLNRNKAKVVSLTAKKSWLKYAAAAVVVGVIGISALLFTRSGNTTDSIPNISKVADQDIINYLEDQSTPAISADDNSGSYASADINEADAKELFSDISDDELQQYVEQPDLAKSLITN